MNTKNETKIVYQIWRNVPAWSNDHQVEAVLYKECLSLLDAGYVQGKLLTQGVTTWLQIKGESKNESL